MWYQRKRNARSVRGVNITTIAYDGKYLAVDSQATDEGTKFSVNKLWKYNKGIFTIAGKWTDYPHFQKLLNHEEEVGKVSKCVCVFTRTGSKRVVEWYSGYVPMKAPPPSAWGSGTDVALGAMFAGADAIEAVKAACKYNIHTGGKVRYVKL